MKKTNSEHCGFNLKDIDYDGRYIILEKNDHSEECKFTFEYIQDLARWTKGKGVWDWRKIHPKKNK